MTDWYYAAGGVQCGPVNVDYLRMLLADKRIERDALVWNASMTEWKPAASLPELMGETAPLFAVGVRKLLVMMFCTLGLYQLYWAFHQWEKIRVRTRQDLMPVLRSIFLIFFFHRLVREVNDAAAAQHIDRRLSVEGLTALFVILTLTQRLPDPAWIISFLVIVPIAMLQKLANEVNQKAAPLADRNEEIRGWDWLPVTLGVVAAVLIMIGLFMPE